MNHHALMVIADEPGTFHWVLLTVDGRQLEENTQSAEEFSTYAAALAAGTLALAAADGEEHKDEVAEPVSDADCAKSDALSKGAEWSQAYGRPLKTK